MKRQGRQAESFCKAPDPDCGAVLLFGKPGAPIDEFAEILKTNWLRAASEPLDVKRVNPEDAKQDPGSIADELFSASLFGGASLIQTNIQRETEAGPFLDALNTLEERGEMPAGRLLVIAGDLTTRSKLRKTFEGAKHATALMLYERSAQEFEGWVRTRIKEEKIALSPEAEDMLIHILMGDQSLAASELDKLSLFALSKNAPITPAEIKDLIALEDHSSHFELIDLALDGKSGELAERIPQISLETSAIPLLIGLVNQLKRLSIAHEIAASGTHGPAIGQRLTPRIFERQWPNFERRMRNWSPGRIIALLSRIQEADASCRRATSPQEAIVGRLLLDISQLVQPQKR